MKRTLLTAAAFLLCGICVFAQSTPDQAELERLYNAAMTPGEEHEFLRRMEGEWDMVSTSYFSPTETSSEQGRAIKKMIMGGRYLQENLTGKVMGMPWEGQSTLAYDNLSKKFRLCWIDNMGTGMMVGEGSKEAERIIIMATYPDVMGGPDQHYQLIFTAESEVKHMMELYLEMPNGEFAKQVDITYKKR